MGGIQALTVEGRAFPVIDIHIEQPTGRARCLQVDADAFGGKRIVLPRKAGERSEKVVPGMDFGQVGKFFPQGIQSPAEKSVRPGWRFVGPRQVQGKKDGERLIFPQGLG